MVELKLENIGGLLFDKKEVPTFYQWSGYAKSLDEFKSYNFKVLNLNEHEIFICSSDNGVGLCDYLSRYVLKDAVLYETEGLLGGGIDYWFLRAWEQAEPEYEEQGWFKEIVDLFLQDSAVVRVHGEDADYICLIDFSRFEDGNVPQEYYKQIEKICETTATEYVLECLDREEKSEEEVERLSTENSGPWFQKLLERIMSL